MSGISKGTTAPDIVTRWLVLLVLSVLLAGFSVGTARAELVAELTASPDPVVAGGQVQYVLTAVNRAGANQNVLLSVHVPAHTSVPVTSAMLSVPLPAETTLVSATDGGTQVGAVVRWELRSLAAGAAPAPKTLLNHQIKGTSVHAIEPPELDPCSSLLPGQRGTPALSGRERIQCAFGDGRKSRNERLLEGGRDYFSEAGQLAFGPFTSNHYIFINLQNHESIACIIH